MLTELEAVGAAVVKPGIGTDDLRTTAAIVAEEYLKSLGLRIEFAAREHLLREFLDPDE